MAKIGYGYGSEWHLLRFLGYHRNHLNDQIEAQTGMKVKDWLDLKFSEKKIKLDLDDEYEGLEFLNENQRSGTEIKWKDFWPASGKQQNWDAVGKVINGTNKKWLLVEAKANVEECKSWCKAKPASENGGRDQILETMEEVIKATTQTKSIDPEIWLNKYYQYANRLAVLYFLTKNGIDTNLLFIYFVGDQIEGKNCPSSVNQWKSIVATIHEHLNIDTQSELMQRVKHLYLPIHK